MDFTNDTKSDENDNDRINDKAPALDDRYYDQLYKQYEYDETEYYNDLRNKIEAKTVPKSINYPCSGETNDQKLNEVHDAGHINETPNEGLMEFDDNYYEESYKQYMYDEYEYYDELYKEFQGEDVTNISPVLQCLNETNRLSTQIHENVASISPTPIMIGSLKDPSKPLGLLNEGVNVCFFNSIIQVLYSLPELRAYVESSTVNNRYMKEMKILFEKIDNQVTNEPVRTSHHVKNPRLEDYRYRDQYDAQECLIRIIENLYPNNKNESIFHFYVNESTVCHGEGCTYVNNKPEPHEDLQLNVFDTDAIQSINTLLEIQMKSERGEEIVYNCEACGAVNNATKSTTFESEPDVLIIHLKLFVYNRLLKRRKIRNVN